MSGYHAGPSAACACVKADCGLAVVEEALAHCPHHSARNADAHPAYACPGK